MDGSSRRAFSLGLLGLGLSGCARQTCTDYSEYLRKLEEENRRIAEAEKARAANREMPAKTPAPELSTIPRSSWAPDPPIRKRLDRMERVTKITVHHEGSGVNTHTSRGDVVADLCDIRRIHLDRMRAGDIGYHYIIDREGRIWEGRPVAYQGAHSGGIANVGNLGVMLLGNFDLQKPADRQLKVLRHFLANQMRVYTVPQSQVFTHQELRATRCPGRHLQRYMDKVRFATRDALTLPLRKI